MSINCPVCQKENRDNAKFCAHCGENFASYTPCTSCHALSKSTKFCTSCGQKMGATVQESVAEVTIPVQAEIAAPPRPAAEAVRLQEPVVARIKQITPQVSATVAKPQTPDPESNPAPVSAPAPFPTPAPAPAPNVAFVTSESASEPAREPAAMKQDVTKKVDSVSSKSNLTMIVGGALGAALLVGGGYWLVAKERAPDPSLSANTSMPISTVQTPTVATAQAAASDTPKVESAPSPEMAVSPQATATAAASSPSTLATSTSSKPAETASAPSAAILVKPKPDVLTTKEPTVKKKSNERVVQETVKNVPAHSATPVPPLAVESPPSPAPKPVARSIDELFNSRVAAECPQGFSGLLCREKVRYSVCDGKWSEQPPAGQLICQGTSTNKNSK